MENQIREGSFSRNFKFALLGALSGFGLPDSGHPAAASIFSSTIKGSGFFYDEVFGIEGSFMAILSMMVVCILFVVIGRKFKKD